MPFTSTDLTNVDAAIIAGATVGRVTVNGKTIEYRSIDQLIKLRGVIQADVQAEAGGCFNKARFDNPI